MTSRRASFVPVIAACTAAGFASECNADTWTTLETDHFEVLSQVPETQSREIIRRLSIYMQALPTLTNLPVRPADTPTRVFLLDGASFDRTRVGHASVAGYFLPRAFRNVIVVDASKNLESSLRIVQHEYVHFAIHNARRADLPAFYEEGLAELLETFEFRGHRFNWGYYPPGYEGIARSKFMPLLRLLSVEVGKGDYVDENRQTPFYARSLLLMHYCNVGKREYREPLLRLAARIADGDSPAEAFDGEFGMSPEEFDAALDMYLARSATQRYVTVPAGEFERDVEIRPLPVAAGAAEVFYGDLLLETVPADAGLEAIFEAQLSNPAIGDRASAGLAMIHERRSRLKESDAELDRIARMPGASVEALIAAGNVLAYRAQQDELDPSLLANVMRRAASYYDAALEKDPRSMEALFGRGYVELYLQDDLESSARRLSQAYPNSNRNADIALLLALHLDALGSKDAAHEIMRSAACAAMSTTMRRRAEKEIGPIRCYRTAQAP